MPGYGTDEGARRGRHIARALVRVPYRLRVTDDWQLPATGPVIIGSNHIGAIDGAIMIAASPRPSFTIAKSGLFVPVIDNIFRWGGLIPIEYDQADRAALLRALEVLERGGVLGIFPEGHRGRGRMEQIRSGLTYLALRSGAPIVPLTLFGTRRTGDGKNWAPKPGTRIDAVFGAPYVPQPRNWHRRSDMTLATEEIRTHLAAEVRRAMARTECSLPEDQFE